MLIPIRNLVLSAFALLCCLSAYSQKNLSYAVEESLIGSTGKSTAFWGVSNQYGAVSTKPNSTALRTKLFVAYDSTKKNKFDYALGVDLNNQFDGNYNPIFQQYYVKLKFRFLHLQGGRFEEYHGNQDSLLSSGNLIYSTNARPIPKITAGILNYTTIPYTANLLEIKGAISHGWFGNDNSVKNAYLHEKYAFIRFGGSFPVKIHAGILHCAQWGGTSPTYGKLPQSLSDYWIIFKAKQVDTIASSNVLSNEYSNRIGNHLGSKYYGLDIDSRFASYSLYYQSIFEDASGLNDHNLKDGLWGVSIVFKKQKYLSRLVYEFIHTTDQSMSWAEDRAMNEPDNYFNHYIYTSGWTNNGYTIGTPLITSPKILQRLNNNNITSLLNNKVVAHHLGLMGEISNYNYRVLLTYTQNYGTYTSPLSNKTAVSNLIEISKNLNKFHDIKLKVAIASDWGQMYKNQSSVIISLSKDGLLF